METIGGFQRKGEAIKASRRQTLRWGLLMLVMSIMATTAVPTIAWEMDIAAGIFFLIVFMAFLTATWLVYGVLAYLRPPEARYHFVAKLRSYLAFPEMFLVESTFLIIMLGMFLGNLMLEQGWAPHLQQGRVVVHDTQSEHTSALPLTVGFGSLIAFRFLSFWLLRKTDFFRKRYVLLVLLVSLMMTLMTAFWCFTEQRYGWLLVMVPMLCITGYCMRILLHKTIHVSFFATSWHPDDGVHAQ